MSEAVAIVLCGGFGTRLGGARAKALLEVGGRPVLDFLAEQLRQLGFERVLVVTNERDRVEFQSWAREWKRRLRGSASIAVYGNGSETADQRLGAVGDLAFIIDRADIRGAALVAAGDNIFEFSLAPFWRTFEARSRSLVLAVPDTNLERLRRTGVLELDDAERVVKLTEKPASPATCWTCPPLYALTAEDLGAVRDYLEAGLDRDEIGRFGAFLADSGRLWAFPVTGKRVDIGTREALDRARDVVGRDFVLAVGDRLSQDRIAEINRTTPIREPHSTRLV